MAAEGGQQILLLLALIAQQAQLGLRRLQAGLLGG
jgi:hypothetical protein